MARISTARRSGDIYDVPSDEDAEEEQEAAVTGATPSPSKQLLNESFTAAGELLSSPVKSVKSVRFEDNPQESSNLLAKVKMTKGKGKESNVVGKDDSAPKAKSRGRPRKTVVAEADKPKKATVGKPKRTYKRTEITASDVPIAPEEPSTPDRRSTKEKRAINRDKTLIQLRSAANQQVSASPSTTPRSSQSRVSDASPRSVGKGWRPEEEEKMLSLRASGKKWDQIAEAMPGRTLVAVETRASLLRRGKIAPLTDGGEVEDGNGKERRASNQGDSPAKRRQTRANSGDIITLHSPIVDVDETVVPRRTARPPQEPAGQKKTAKPTAKIVAPKSNNTLAKATERGIFVDQAEGSDYEDAAEAGADEQEADQDADDEIQEASMLTLPDADGLEDRLHGQLSNLQAIVDSVVTYKNHVKETLEIDYRAKKQLASMKTSEKLRNKLRADYAKLLNAGDAAGQGEDEDEDDEDSDAETTGKDVAGGKEPSTDIKEEIHDTLLEYIDLASSIKPDSSNAPKKTLNQTYAFLIVDLVSVLSRAARVYNKLAITEYPDGGDIEIPELNQLIKLITCIITTGERVRQCKTKIDSTLQLVKPVRNDIIAPLKKVLDAFTRARILLRNERDEAEIERERRETIKKEMEREEARKERQKWEDRIEKRLRFLYSERQKYGKARYDPRKFGMPRVTFGAHRTPYPFGVDSDGMPMERVDIFGARTNGRKRSQRDQDSAEEDEDDTPVNVAKYTETQVIAIEKALQTCRGRSTDPTLRHSTTATHNDDYTWALIFKHFCGYKCPLEDLTVHELLRLARDFRYANLYPEGEEGDGVVCDEEWIVDVPDLDLLKFLPEGGDGGGEW
ncbi:hypothetical protein EJ08DRAFT_299453 [Tothia fuscella]|uniref:Myb-like domain-containing protein n=1 Tax=Tothia fuscella TaxID=1048955 RepID=A0A9P4NQ20_9PEZI|nr:hypothetical protein EJ08DRAFT_299453 [Tothia fuscella]